jgi:hypothetical protein
MLSRAITPAAALPGIGHQVDVVGVTSEPTTPRA